MKITLTFCMFGVLAAGSALGQTQEMKKSTPSSPKGEKKELKLPAPTKHQQKLMDSYGSTKQFCCQLGNSCISGPKGGSDVCKELGGTPYSNSACVPGGTPKEHKGGKCIDP